MRGAQGKPVGHHLTYQLLLPNGEILRTRVSKPPNKDTYGPDVWGHILRDQLQVDEAAFWACVQNGERPNRNQPEVATTEAVPSDLAHLLKVHLGLSDAEIQEMSKQEAVERMNQVWQG